MATTFRSDIATGIFSVLDVYRTANPSRLVRAYRARPSSVGPDLPCAWVDGRPETIAHDSTVRTRTMTPSVLVVRDGGDNAEDALAFDQLVDALVDAFTAQPQFAATTIWSRMAVSDEEVQVGDYLFPAVRLSWPDITIMERRV
jgi:hypothetical protein